MNFQKGIRVITNTPWVNICFKGPRGFSFAYLLQLALTGLQTTANSAADGTSAWFGVALSLGCYRVQSRLTMSLGSSAAGWDDRGSSDGLVEDADGRNSAAFNRGGRVCRKSDRKRLGP